ncbi:AAA family ATPase [Pseudoramibacter sp.]|jgi:Mrp family chromosome partitioning ATPase|uniref:AAA family ATPase n=1 Tax=Pseudoramibacter sp. TaxID=2034862 RepID=UPI0025E35BB0|nr:AAA family ATPase [Pseudoramibacter sp.]MCH4073142.1 AAA family ATPase [Pseudoramibacter sp.]MCH4106914.1 AAA family ATPase [Pseudoramibacter sp.]
MGLFKWGKERPISNTALSQTQDTAYRESYRRLCYNILALPLAEAKRPKVLLLNGPKDGQGTTTAALNVAEALSAVHQQVLLIEADCRKPQMEKRLHCSSEKSFNAFFDCQANVAQCIERRASQPFDFILSKPSDALIFPADALVRLKGELADLPYDWILIDTPPADQSADALALSQIANGVLLVVRKLDATRQATRSLLANYQQNHVQVVGSVLTFDNPY